MRSFAIKILTIFTLGIILSTSCIKKPEVKNNGVLILKRDENSSKCAYYDENGNKILGDYYDAFTDTIKDFGIVADSGGFVLIDKTGKIVYHIFPFDCSPDRTIEGYYRIVDNNGKVGYVDSLTSKLIIKPQFVCASPFEKGIAKVSYCAKKVYMDDAHEHWIWESNEWFYIDKKGNKITN